MSPNKRMELARHCHHLARCESLAAHLDCSAQENHMGRKLAQ